MAPKEGGGSGEKKGIGPGQKLGGDQKPGRDKDERDPRSKKPDRRVAK
jgi:hypothetical protein